ncbi:hypothetical protein TNCV_1316231 [Trichonephila clavipes]|nr:hypothetical protein TNCV_1316231 [Trichonephila clavipes]
MKIMMEYWVANMETLRSTALSATSSKKLENLILHSKNNPKTPTRFETGIFLLEKNCYTNPQTYDLTLFFFSDVVQLSINVVQLRVLGCLGGGSRDFEQWSSDEDDTCEPALNTTLIKDA